jgi:hypothetical protein
MHNGDRSTAHVQSTSVTIINILLCRRHKLLRGARWRTTVSRGGLHHGSSHRRHAALYGAWRRPTVSTGGLLQPRCCTQRVLQALCKGCTGDSTVTAAHCSTAGPEFVPGFQGRFGGAWTRALVECSAGPRLGERLVQAAHLHLCCCHSLLLTTIARWRHLTAGRLVAGVSSKTCELVCMTCNHSSVQT